MRVSIPTRLERRVQPDVSVSMHEADGFQSPPASRGGCNSPNESPLRPTPDGFNPHPPREAGATTNPPTSNVTIVEFQSPPASRGGCNYRGQRPSRCGGQGSFNPHPPREAGATASWPSINPLLIVSIPTRLERRVQPAQSHRHYSGNMFQSPPASRGGCNIGATGDNVVKLLVSIPTRLERRVQRPKTYANLGVAEWLRLLTA